MKRKHTMLLIAGQINYLKDIAHDNIRKVRILS